MTGNPWPRQQDCMKFYGPVGRSQVLYTPPYQFYLYDTTTPVRRISLHEKVVDSADRVLNQVLDRYGTDAISDLHLDRFFGSLNVRQMRGGSAWSMHSWGIALDFDANRNQLKWNSQRAAFAQPEYDDWWACWEAEGWTSLGRARDFDWMHVQAANL